MNKFVLIGNLTKDIEITKAGEASLAEFVLAVNRSYKNREGVRESDFILVKAWRETAERLASWTKKGDKILVEGEIQTSNYEKDGKKNYVTEFMIREFELLSGKKDETVGEVNA